MNDVLSPSAKDAALESLIARVADDYLERLDKGEQPELEEYVRCFPDLASVLPQVIPALRLIRSISAPEIEFGDALVQLGSKRACLGDYRLLREIGRGGMGIVYEAQQISLDRRVALKVLRFAGGLDAKYLQRFKNEAQAAAGLHHTNIVPVFAVGNERAVHYYAMQFISGQTLAALIHELRQIRGFEIQASQEPSSFLLESGKQVELGLEQTEHHSNLGPVPAAETQSLAGQLTDASNRRSDFFRTVALLGVQAAAALEHAHQQGIVHRDIKPANLLVETSTPRAKHGALHLWVTDFGLARLQSDHGLTLTGDILGTLRYMSPEQALARHALVDHRTDIYSLGATLYELLTLHPVLKGVDRQDLIRQIIHEEPRLPRSINRDIPMELETIVLKALAKEPQERYASAQELQDDLQRFLEDRPILARRPTMVQRSAKWVRRHKPAVAFVMGLFVLALLSSVISTILIYQQQRLTQDAYKSEANERAKTEENLRLALRALDEILSAAEKQLPRDAQREREDRETLKKALKFYEDFAKNNANEPQVRKEAAKAYLRVGSIQQKLGQTAQAEQSYYQALRLLGALAARLPEEAGYRLELARGHHLLSRLFQTTGRFSEAVKSCEMALSIRLNLNEEFSSNAEVSKDLASSYLNMGNLQKIMGSHDKAQEAYAKALSQFEGLAASSSVPDYQQGIASCLNNLGILLVESNHLQEAETSHRRAVALYLDLNANHPESPDYQQELAASQINLANLLKTTGRVDEAETICLEAINRWDGLVDAYPMVPGYRQELADSYHNLGIFYQETYRAKKAEDAFQESVALYQGLTKDFPNSSKYSRNLGTTLFRLALLLRHPDQLIAPHQLGPVNGNLRAGGESKCPGPGKNPMAHAVIVDQQKGSSRHKQKTAETRMEREVTCQEDSAVTKERDMSQTEERRQRLARHYFAQARANYQEAIRRSGNDPCSRNDLAWFLATCPDEELRDLNEAERLMAGVVEAAPRICGYWNTLGVVHYRKGHWREAAQALEKSTSLHPQGGDSFDWFFLAMAHYRLGDKERAHTWYKKAIAWMETNQQGLEELTRFRAEAAALLGMDIHPAKSALPIG
jgi:eukaryotic-like serine/threonine-protein kinase